MLSGWASLTAIAGLIFLLAALFAPHAYASRRRADARQRAAFQGAPDLLRRRERIRTSTTVPRWRALSMFGNPGASSSRDARGRRPAASLFPSANPGSTCLGRCFSGRDLDRLDRRRAGEQFRRLGHQGLRDRAGEMRLAAGFVVEGVEHAEGRRRQAQREPDRRGGFLAREGQTGGEESATAASLPGLASRRANSASLIIVFLLCRVAAGAELPRHAMGGL